MALAGFKPPIPTIKCLHTHTINRTTIGMGFFFIHKKVNFVKNVGAQTGTVALPLAFWATDVRVDLSPQLSFQSKDELVLLISSAA
jgi:hypothetical protein